MRAQSVNESYWDQRAGGDLTTNTADCPPGHRNGEDGHGDQCPESWGIQQVRYSTFRWAYPESPVR